MLIRNWRRVLRSAWSVRFMAAAVLLSGIEAALAVLDPYFLGISPGFFAAATAVVSAAALLARLLVQSNIGDRDADL